MPVLFVCVTIAGRVTLRPIYDPRRDGVAVAWATSPLVHRLTDALEHTVGRDSFGRFNDLPGFDPFDLDPNDSNLINACIRLRDAIHRQMGWPKGPRID